MSEKDTATDQTQRHSPSLNGSTETVRELETGKRDSYGEPNANSVDVKDAIVEYNEMRRELSRISRQASHHSKLEEGVAAQDEFDLTEFLSGVRNDNEQSGIKKKSLGLIWKDLVVEGLGADSHIIPTVGNELIRVLQFWKFLGIGKSSSRKTILRGLSGFCRDGEMLLVLGRPGAGCSTFLKVLANMRSSYTHVGGTVSYGGIDPKTFAKHYRGQVVYNEEEDQNYPTLTTKQTLEFALRNKTPGTRLPDETKKEFANKVIYMLGNMLGLTKQMGTMVGDAYVRGLSGGERKRLSIAEVMTTQSCINCWDCSTRGLDAASALDYVRSLRIMTDVLDKTTISTLYQASNSIFALYDKVLLLDNGYCMYFGPVNECKQYFEDLGFYCPPRKSTPDFLTGLCNPIEREILPGYENTAPQHAHEFQERFYQSEIYKRMMTELAEYEKEIERENPSKAFEEAVAEEHQKFASKQNPYTASFFQQVKALTIREHLLVWKNKGALISRYGSTIVQGLITASCFFKMPLTGTGAFSRGGALFFSILFTALISQAELMRFVTGRPVLEKHKHFAMYRPSAYYIAQVMLDIPYAIVQALLFEICAYFMMGLNLDAGRFFTFFILLTLISLTMNGFFRLCGAITPTFFQATQISGTLLVAMQIYTGYVIPYDTMHPWLFWIYWINPLAYGYKALVSNEMKGQIYSCEGFGNAVPFGPGYDDFRYKACTMKGGNPGENFVTGTNYLHAALKYETRHLWAPDFVALIGFFLLFTVLTALAMEYLSVNKAGTLTKLYLPGKAPKERTDEEEDARRRKQAESGNNMTAVGEGTTFSWHHVHYHVPYKGGPLHLLNDISGIVKPGHLTALMGSSGAGKTTLLDVLARRKTIGKIEGDIFLNGEALMSDFERITGYCEQMDVHQPYQTVRESLRFSAYLRQDPSIPKEEKDAYVEQIIELLEMEDIADAQIGEVETGFGISVEERKRLTIGVELVGKPKLLFLDEPTSGLDAQSSFNIIRFIRKLADAGWPVLCTIHQPSAVLFEHFDHLLLLVRGGKTAYYGEIGKDASTMINYFESNGGPICSKEANPAEYILEVVGAGTAGKATRDWAEIWTKSPEAAALEEELCAIDAAAIKEPTREVMTYSTPFWTQFLLVFHRMFVAYWRSPEYNLGRFIVVMFTSLFTGFTFWKLSYTSTDMQNRLFALFSSFLMGVIFIVLGQPKFMTERVHFRREYAARYYGFVPFALSVILVEIPYILTFSAFYMFGFYWTTGMVNESENVGFFYVHVIVFMFWACTLGFIIAAFTESPVTASVLNPIIVSYLILLAGMMQPPDAMPKFWRSWMYWLNPMHYYIEGLVVNEMEKLPVICKERDLVKFLPPPNQTCGEYLTNYFESGGLGYVANPEASQPDYCNYCNFKSGKEYYSVTYQWDAAHKWRNFGILIAFFIFNIFAFVFFCFLKRKPRR